MSVRRLPRYLLAIAAPVAIILVIGLLLQVTGMIGVILDQWDDIIFLSGQQLVLVGVSGGLAVLFGVTMGIILSRPPLRGAASNLMQLLNIATAVPTLALLALSMSFLGIGRWPAIFALWVASLLPIVRNTFVGLLEVPEALLEAASGMGMRPSDILRYVEIPNALWVIFAGVRTAITINVGTAPLAFLIGGGGLGQLIFTGISLDQPDMMVAGAVATAVMAVVIDFVIASFARLVVSRGIAPAT
jgi:osmoprotectant transport system permease protein